MNKDKRDIIRMMVDSDWEYQQHVVSEVMFSCIGVYNDSAGDVSSMIFKVLHDKDGNQVGFYILRKFKGNWKKVEIKYLFIKPEYREKGYASRILRSIQTKSNNIYLDTKDERIINFISKLGFKEVGLCANGVERCFHYGEMAEGDVCFAR